MNYLPHLGVLRFAGVDAGQFLQGQVSNDTRRLAEGQPLLAAYSTPQGRVAAVLTLLPHSTGILALVPRELAQPTLERLRKYVLRAKVTVEDLSDQYAVAGRRVATAPKPTPTPTADYAEQDGVGVARVIGDPTRLWVVGPEHALSQQPDDGISASEWRLADIRAGLPQIYAPTSELFVAQMLNLDRLDGISFTKGCFTGQEIIARTQHLGRIKRRLYRLRLTAGSWAVGDSIRLADGRAGRVTEVAALDAGGNGNRPAECEALAVLNVAAAAATSEDAAVPDGSAENDTGAAAVTASVVGAVELPLPYALAP